MISELPTPADETQLLDDDSVAYEGLIGNDQDESMISFTSDGGVTGTLLKEGEQIREESRIHLLVKYFGRLRKYWE